MSNVRDWQLPICKLISDQTKIPKDNAINPTNTIIAATTKTETIFLQRIKAEIGSKIAYNVLRQL